LIGQLIRCVDVNNSAWWIWPDIIVWELVFILLFLTSIIMPVVIGDIKFAKVISYHTWLVMFAAVYTAPSAIILFLHGPAWPFRVATLVCLLAAIEEIAITVAIEKSDSNVRCLVHVLRKSANKPD